MVYIMLADGFEEIEALAVVDILRRGDVKISTVSVYNKQTVIGAHSINVIPDIMFDDISYDDCECIILPGGMPGTINLQENSKLVTLLKKAFSDKKYIGAICAAPMILGQLGFLKDKEATCYPSFEEYLLDAKVSNKRVCLTENIITSRGAGTAHDFAFSLLEMLKGKETSDKIRESMLYDC